MTDLEKLQTYVERLAELQKLNSVYRDITITIPPETMITEKWHNGSADKFHSVEFPFRHIEDINRRLYEKIRYRQSKVS